MFQYRANLSTNTIFCVLLMLTYSMWIRANCQGLKLHTSSRCSAILQYSCFLIITIILVINSAIQLIKKTRGSLIEFCLQCLIFCVGYHWVPCQIYIYGNIVIMPTCSRIWVYSFFKLDMLSTSVNFTIIVNRGWAHFAYI